VSDETGGKKVLMRYLIVPETGLVLGTDEMNEDIMSYAIFGDAGDWVGKQTIIDTKEMKYLSYYDGFIWLDIEEEA